jgi:hypothetical protein
MTRARAAARQAGTCSIRGSSKVKNIKLIIALFFFMSVFNSVSFAESHERNKFDYLEILTHLETLTNPIKRHLRKNKIDLNFFAGFLQGYDNNVNLDPERKSDTFSEISLDTEATYNYTDDVRLKVENYTTNILYYEVTDANLLDIYNKAALEADILDDILTLGLDYALELAIFPRDEDGTYLGNEARLSVRHNIAPGFYHRLRYKYLHKSFSHDKTLDPEANRTGNLRRDNRYGMDYEIGARLLNSVMFKTSLELYRNDANYTYFKYYDYWSFRIKPSILVKLAKNLYTNANFSYRQRRYAERLSSQDDSHVYDDTYSVNLSVLYDLSKSFTVALNYSYRENESNEPLQKHSGSVFTGGLYYSF